ncbi:MAG: hypothetical protein KGJ07_01480 [Patescibacteria group bacterium]|nr:hypothetical protein [Patescibacteria group bacterium]
MLPLIFFIALILEATIVQLPLVLLVLLTVTIIYQSEWVFFAAIILGIMLDSLLFRIIGSTGLFFLFFLLFVFLYERKFEIRTVQFAAMISFLGSFLYLLIFGHSLLWLQVLLSVVIGVVCFICLAFSKKAQKIDSSFALRP